MFGLPLHLAGHIILMIGMLVFVLIGVVQARIRRKFWLKLHRRMTLIGVILGVSGALVMAIYKIIHGYGHIQTEHSEMGLSALILLIVLPVSGTLIMKKFNLLKWPHRILGYGAAVIALIAAYLGYSILAG